MTASRVVVVGATGNIGTALISALSREPEIESITGLARRVPDWQPDKTTWVAADITDDDLVTHFRGADAVVHLAWAFQPTHDPLETWRVNVTGSERVFQAAADAGVSALIYSSSVGAYSPGPKDLAVDETWPTHGLPTAAYGREKAYVERLLDAFECDHPGVRTVRLRPGFVFQEGAASEQWRIFAGRVIPSRAIRRSTVPIVPRTDGLRFQVIHAVDAADAFRRAIMSDVRGAFNIAADPPVSADQLGEVFDAKPVPVPRSILRSVFAIGWHLRVLPSSPNLVDLALSLPIMDTARAERELGWRASRSSTDALNALVDGLESGSGMATEPLAPAAPGKIEEPAR